MTIDEKIIDIIQEAQHLEEHRDPTAWGWGVKEIKKLIQSESKAYLMEREEASLLVVELTGNYLGAVTSYAARGSDDDRKRAEEMINDYTEKAIKLKKIIEKL